MYDVSRGHGGYALILAAALLWLAAPAGASNGNACGDLEDVHAPVHLGGGVDVNEALDAISGRSLYHGLIDTSFHVATLKSWDYQSLFDRMRDQRVKRYHDPTASLGGTWNAAQSLQQMYAANDGGRIVVADVIEEPEAGEEAPPPRRRPEPLPEPAPAPPPPAVVPAAASVLGAWAIGFGVWADQDEDFSCTRSEQDWDAAGFTVGLDKSVNDYSSVGLLGGYHHMDGDFDDFGTEADDDAGSVGLYGTWADGSGVHGSLAAYYTYHDWDTEKEFAGLDADSEPNGHQATVYGSIGYDVRMGPEGDTTVGPYAALQYSFLHVDDFDEDASAIAADYDEEDFHSLASQLGARLAHRMTFGWGTLTPEVRAAWLHEFLGDDEDVDGAFLGGGPLSFDTDVAERDYALVGAGFTATFASWPNVHVFLGYDGRFGDEFDSHGATGGVWVEF